MASLLLFWAARPYVCWLCPACARPKASPSSRREGLVRPGGCVFAGDFLRRRCPGGGDAAWTLIKWLWGRMSCWLVPYSCWSFLRLPQHSWLREVVGEGLTFSWLSPAWGWLKPPVRLSPFPIVVLGARWRCCPLSGVPHICLTVSQGVSSLFLSASPVSPGSWLCAGRGAQPGLGGTARPLLCSASHSG